MIFLIDTNVLSEPARPSPNAAVRSHLQQRRFDICVCATVWQEFILGIELQQRSERRARLMEYRRFLEDTGIEIVPFDHSAAQWMAREQARLIKAGRPPAYRDLQIASVAAVNDLTVVTRNVIDFESVRGIRLENWFAD